MQKPGDFASPPSPIRIRLKKLYLAVQVYLHTRLSADEI